MNQNSPIEFDPASPAFAENPYGVYRQLRALDEPWYSPTTRSYLLSRYEVVDAAARNPLLVRGDESFTTPEQRRLNQEEANWHNMPNHEQFVQFSLLEVDGEQHQRLRRVVMKHMHRRRVQSMQSFVEHQVSELLNEVLQGGQVDFINAFAAHLPGYIIGHLLGVPDQDCPTLRKWSEDIVQYFDVNRTTERKQRAERATAEFAQFIEELIRTKTRQPDDSLIFDLMGEENSGALNRQELISTCMLILMAGHGSTIDLCGNGLLALLQHPAHMQTLRAQPELMPAAVEEMFRFDAPLPYFHRYASTQVTVMGQDFPAGTCFGLLYGAANRDETQFDHPDEFRLDRSNLRHLAFGRGAHLCLGNHLSRLELTITFQQLLQTTRHIELTSPPQFKAGLSARGLQRLELVVSAA